MTDRTNIVITPRIDDEGRRVFAVECAVHGTVTVTYRLYQADDERMWHRADAHPGEGPTCDPLCYLNHAHNFDAAGLADRFRWQGGAQ